MEQSDLYLLQHVPPYHLQALGRARHIPMPAAAQGAAGMGESSLTELGEQLFDPAACREVIRGLEQADLAILQELTSCGGRANSRDLALYLSGASFTDPAHLRAPQYPPPHPHGAFEQAVHRLIALGLLFWGKQTSFAGRDYANGVYDGVLIVPQAIMHAVQFIDAEREEHSTQQESPSATFGEQHRHAERSEASLVQQQESPPTTFGEEAHRLQRSLYLYWSLVAAQRDGLPLVNSKLLSRPALRQVVEQLTTLNVEQIRVEADVPRLLFIRLLMTNLGLLHERSGAIYPAPVASAGAYFTLPLVERARRCYRLWLDTPFWNELNYLPGVVLRPAPGPVDAAHAEVARARAMLIEQVAQAQAGVPQALSTFIARAKLHIPYLLFPRDYGARAERYSIGSNPYSLDFRLKHGWLTHREGWYLVEGGFIRAVFSGPLRWLGLVEIDEEADTFTLLPALRSTVMLSAAQHLSTADLSATPPFREDGEHPPITLSETWGRLIVQPNFELVALAPVSEALLLRLDRFAERVRLEQIAQYRLTRASVTHAVQVGMPAEEILRVLEEASSGTIPQNVYYSLKEWERHARRVELWPRMALLEVESEAMLDAFYSDDTARPLLGRRLSPTLAEVAADQLETLQQLLWQREFLPALAAAPAYTTLLESASHLPSHEAQWRLLEGGMLQPCYPVLNLYLAAELERFTVLDEQSGWRRITPASIQEACNNAIPLDAIVRFLQRYCEGGLPASFLIRLKLWGDGYQQQDLIQVEAAPLLRLSASALRDIQADEELGALLDAEVPPGSRLVRVAPHALARILELLRERGFTIEE
jgi:Helicase conserved C-terminal domain